MIRLLVGLLVKVDVLVNEGVNGFVGVSVFMVDEAVQVTEGVDVKVMSIVEVIVSESDN
jgi:hypothetical protein